MSFNFTNTTVFNNFSDVSSTFDFNNTFPTIETTSNYLEDIQEEYWFIAIILSVTGNLIDAVGWIIEKKSHNDIRDTDPNKSFVKSRQWWCGFSVHAIGGLIAAIAYGFGPQSLLVPLESVTLVFNAFLAHKYLGERLRPQDIIGTIIIMVGCVLAVLWGPRGTGQLYTAEVLEDLFRQASFLIFSCIITVLVGSNYIIFKMCTRLRMNKSFCLLSLCCFASYFASWNTLFTKCVMGVFTSSAVSSEIAKENWTHWLSYVLILLLVFTSVSLEYWRQMALKDFKASYVGAIYTYLMIVGGLFFGAYFFNEFDDMGMQQSLLFLGSILLSFGGVGLMSMPTIYGRNDSDDHEELNLTDGDLTSSSKDDIAHVDGDVDDDESSQYKAKKNETGYDKEIEVQELLS